MKLFFELIQVSIGCRKALTKNPSEVEWRKLYVMAKQHAISGFVFSAIDKLSKEGQKPPSDLLFEWLGLTMQIGQKNLLLNRRCAEITQLFDKEGLRSCILKGQGNALYYSDKLSRSPGDIDIWVDASKDEIIKYVTEKCPKANVLYYHVSFPIYDDVEVEVHYTPAVSVVWRYEKKYQSFYRQQAETQFEHRVSLPNNAGEISVPTLEFNLVFQMAHMMRHFFSEGLGLRQVIDYYFLLKSNIEYKKSKVKEILENLGMKRFSGAMMWVLNNCIGLEDKYLLMPADEIRGRVVLDEIMQCGNFGHYDRRKAKKLKVYSFTLSVFAKNIKMLRFFPEEVLLGPITNSLRYYL